MGSLEGERQLQARLTAIGDVDGRFGSRTVRRWQIKTVAYAKRTVPRRTGNLGRSIQPGPITGDSGTVVAQARYAAYVEHGTRAHIIQPRDARVLAWGGSRTLAGNLRSGSAPTHFAMFVRHPGTRAQPFLRPAAERAMGELELGGDIVVAWNGAA